ncbi:MAG: 2Fe-2S iron-sulfur cluster-binding protein, partial [Phycisphaerae bacterium]|nr:2Fe-2S iron-sulfur cluster-binding protein [Phycisphaerae bacterium]
MSDVRVTINGQDYSAQPGQTILQVCWANRIYVPTLCHYKGLKDIGACRLCIVEIQGQRRPVPACTTPVGHEMVVSTSTPLLEDLRRQTLELIFGERNHICPFCPRSGHCELQTAAYKHNMDHVRYDYLFPQLPVDSSHLRIAMDHNRCILCSRCIRACDQWVGAHVLDLNHRGAAAMVIADSGVPLGQSSCVSCGTCVAVCPTGALFEKRSAHWQGRLPLQLTETICPSCGVGCRVNASVRHRQIGSIVSAGGPAGNRILCYRGRFDLVNPTRGRVEAIQMKRGTQWVQRSLDDVLRECAVRLSSAPIHADPNRVIGLLSPRLPLETLAAVQGFITKVVGSSRWTIVDRSDAAGVNEALDLEGRVAPLAGLSDLDEADMYLLLGCHLERSHGVVASYVRRGILHRRAKLVKVNPRHTWLTDWTDLNVPVERGKDVAFLAAMLKYLWEMGKAQLTLTPEMEQKLKALDDADVTRAVGVPAADI